MVLEAHRKNLNNLRDAYARMESIRREDSEESSNEDDEFYDCKGEKIILKYSQSQIIPYINLDNYYFGIFGHIPKLFFRDADDFDSKTPSSNIEGVKKLVNVVL